MRETELLRSQAESNAEMLARVVADLSTKSAELSAKSAEHEAQREQITRLKEELHSSETVSGACRFAVLVDRILFVPFLFLIFPSLSFSFLYFSMLCFHLH